MVFVVSFEHFMTFRRTVAPLPAAPSPVPSRAVAPRPAPSVRRWLAAQTFVCLSAAEPVLVSTVRGPWSVGPPSAPCRRGTGSVISPEAGRLLQR